MTKDEALKKINELKQFVQNYKEEVKWVKIGDLEWSEDLGCMTWNEATAKAKELGARLPERWEMVKAVDEHFDEMNKLIEDSPSNTFWSATENDASAAWYVYLCSGYTYSGAKTTSSQVRLVRDTK